MDERPKGRDGQYGLRRTPENTQYERKRKALLREKEDFSTAPQKLAADAEREA